MPPFEDKLSDQEIDQAIAFFQSKWPDDLYRKWAGRFEPAALPSLSDIEVAFKSSITQHLRKRLGEIELGDPKETAVEDLWQVKLKNRYLYLIDGGRYALIGDLIDLQNGQNLTEKERRRHAVSEISKYRDYQLVVFRPASDVKTTLNVFTDTSCAFCQKLHRELPRLLEAGIQVRYLPYPRGGSNGPGYNTLKSVWCAADRQQAITDAKNEKTAGLPAGDCAVSEMVDQGFQTGNALGITGTPALFKKSGEKIEGYVPYQQLIPMLLGN